MKYKLPSLLLLCLFSNACCSFGVENQPFRSRKSPSETIYKYVEVHPNIVSSAQVSLENHPKNLQITLDLDTIQYKLNLQLNELLLPSHFISTHHDQAGEEIKQGHQNCFYQGTVLNHTDWKAAFSTCYGLRGWFGDLNDKNNLYHIEPLDDTNRLDSSHILYMESEHKNVKNGVCGTTHEHDIGDTIHASQAFKNTRLKRQSNGDDLLVELLVVNDYYQYIAHDQNLSSVVHRAIEIVNQIDLLYQVLDVRIILVNSMTLTQSQQIPLENDASTLLDLFRVYHRENINPTISHDSAMMITGLDIAGSTVGIAFVGTMCNFDTSVGITQDTGSFASSIAAHELGHIFSMQHDDVSSCNCPDQSSSGCIMNAASGFPPPTQWSQCSRNELESGLENGLGSCLDNNPTTLVGEARCGNGIKEPNEVCDCGSPEECQDPCCNATTCVLNNNAQCATGPCCTNCQFVDYGTVCRESTEVCGVTEYCTGEDSDCPRDVYLQNGLPCNNGTSYCYDGNCASHMEQCLQYYGDASVPSVDECYEVQNLEGEPYGNCGASGGNFVPCTIENAHCGSLQCDGGQIIFNNIQFTGSITAYTRSVLAEGDFRQCQSFSTAADSDEINPGLVTDGTKCGDEMLCVAQSCVSVTSLGVTPCPVGRNGELCSGNGVCNNLDECSCFESYIGDDCSERRSISKSSTDTTLKTMETDNTKTQTITTTIRPTSPTLNHIPSTTITKHTTTQIHVATTIRSEITPIVTKMTTRSESETSVVRTQSETNVVRTQSETRTEILDPTPVLSSTYSLLKTTSITSRDSFNTKSSSSEPSSTGGGSDGFVAAISMFTGSNTGAIVGGVVAGFVVLLAIAAVIVILVVIVVFKKEKSSSVDLPSPRARYSRGPISDNKIVGIHSSTDDLLRSAERIDGGSSPTNVPPTRRPPPPAPTYTPYIPPPYTPYPNPSVTINNNIRKPPPPIPPLRGTTKPTYESDQSPKPHPLPVARSAPRPLPPTTAPPKPVSKPVPKPRIPPGPSPSKPVVPPPKPQTAPKPSKLQGQWPPPSSQDNKPVPPKKPFIPPKN